MNNKDSINPAMRAAMKRHPNLKFASDEEITQKAKDSREKYLKEVFPFTKDDLENKCPHLVSCDASTPPSERELFICQTDVLLDTLKIGRNFSYQAVWPIRGKIPNVQKTHAMHSGPLVELLYVLFGETPVIKFQGNEAAALDTIDQIPMQYENIILALDSDHDGNHLTILLLGFFEKYLPHLFEQGRIFINMAPFKKVLSEDGSRYEFLFKPQKLNSQDEAILTLGEMQERDVFDHITNPKTRRLARLFTRDMQGFHDTIEIAQSSNVQMRSAFLKDNKSQSLRTHRNPEVGVISTIDPSQLVIDSVQSYASYINHGRALCDIASGLTNSERDLMITALERNTHNLEHAFQLVGHTMLASYGTLSENILKDSLIRLSKAGLIDIVGNPHRLHSLYYKLTKLGLLADFKPTIRQDLTFDWPNILTKDHVGIGYGVSSNIPSHNFKEVIQATLAVIDNPNISLMNLMKIMPGPDLKNRGILADSPYEAYRTGRGTYTILGTAHVEDDCVIVTKLPVDSQEFIADMKKGYLANDGIEKLIDGTPVDISDKSGTKIKIPISSHAVSAKRSNGELLIEHLEKYRSFKNHQVINFTVSHDREIREMSLIDLIKEWISLREEFIMDRYEIDQESARKKMRQQLQDLL